MKTAKFSLMFLACTAALPAVAQNTMDARCGTTNFDRARDVYTIVNPGSGTANQQCFITVVPKAAWPGGAPSLASSELVEGNYDVVLSGGGGGAGGSAIRTGLGFDGADAVPFKGTRYLPPGVYRLTFGYGGQGGRPCVTEERGGRGADGAPTGLSEAYSGQTIAGYPRAESWDGRYAGSYPVASVGQTPGSMDVGNMTPAARIGDLGGGGHSVGGTGDCQVGAQGGPGFIKLALADAAPQPAPVQQPVQPAAPAASSDTMTTPPPAAVIRPARRDRN